MAPISCFVRASYTKSVSFIEFLMNFCISGDNLGAILITDKKLFVKLPKLGQILREDETAWFSQARLHSYIGQFKQ